MCIVRQIFPDDKVELYSVNSLTNVFIRKTCIFLHVFFFNIEFI